MFNVIELFKSHEEKPRFRRDAARGGPARPVTEMTDMASHVQGLRTKVKLQLRDTILLLDLAAENVRRVCGIIADPAIKKRLEDELSAVSELLQVARDRTRQL